jgi:hypothetical protein
VGHEQPRQFAARATASARSALPRKRVRSVARSRPRQTNGNAIKHVRAVCAHQRLRVRFGRRAEALFPLFGLRVRLVFHLPRLHHLLCENWAGVVFRLDQMNTGAAYVLACRNHSLMNAKAVHAVPVFGNKAGWTLRMWPRKRASVLGPSLRR